MGNSRTAKREAAREDRRQQKDRSDARAADVAATMDRLRGRSNAELTPDDRRGASSPIGHGEIAEREAANRRRR